MEEVVIEINPPDKGFVRFCPECGRNDRASRLNDRHFAKGGLCAGEPVTLEYALVDAERSRLEREVIEASLRLRRSTLALKKHFDDTDENDPNDAMEIYNLSGEDVAARAAFDLATDTLIEFESNQIKK